LEEITGNHGHAQRVLDAKDIGGCHLS